MRVRRDPRTLAPEALLSMNQAAELLNVSIPMVRALVRRGEVVSVPWGKTDVRVPRRAITEWIDRQFDEHAKRYESMDRILTFSRSAVR